MERRIRIIWILSLASALLLVGMQGYWLLSQYQYTLDNYARETGEAILKAGDEEYTIRKDMKSSTYIYALNNKRTFGNNSEDRSPRNRISFAISFIDSVHNKDLSPDINRALANKELQKELESIEKDPMKYYRQQDTIKSISKDSTLLRLSFSDQMSDDELNLAINRSVVNYTTPFEQQRLDSILAANLPSLSYNIKPLTADTTNPQQTSSWKRAGNLFSPSVNVSYVYSPLENKGILITASLPVQAVFKRMALQLVLACALILLMIGCLVFQIKTILRQRKLNELRQSFVNTMIHELRRPVQTLKTFVAFLGDKTMRSDEKLTGQVIQDSVFELDNLSAYLNKLKDMVRADDADTPLNRTRFNLQELTDKVIRLTHIPTGKEVRFNTSFEMESPHIEADAVHVANIISNLIENAVKYSGDKVEVCITARQKGRELWITVSDNGIGIPLVDQERVFVKFYRGSNHPGDNLPGLGLGLSYVKLISQAHQGHVSLQSRIGEGTSVTLFLPQ